MAIRNKGPFTMGLFLALSFIGVLILIFSPIYGGGMNGLDYADDLFNKLSKGSSYFIPKLKEANKKFQGKTFAFTLTLKIPRKPNRSAKLFTAAGCKVEVQGDPGKDRRGLGKNHGPDLEGFGLYVQQPRARGHERLWV